MHDGRTLVLAVMHLLRSGDHCVVVFVQKLGIGLRDEQVQIERCQFRGLLHGVLRRRKTLERKLRPAQIEIGKWQVAVQRNGLSEFGLRLLILFQIQLRGAQGVVRRHETWINRHRPGQVLDCAVVILLY